MEAPSKTDDEVLGKGPSGAATAASWSTASQAKQTAQSEACILIRVAMSEAIAKQVLEMWRSDA